MDNRFTILVVDDEVEICCIFREFLTVRGFDIITAHTGEEALRIMDTQNIDLILIDKRMPGIGGMAVLRELRRIESTLPVIVLSGSNDITGNFDEIKKMGYKKIFTKPIDLNSIFDEINKVLETFTDHGAKFTG